MAGFKGQGELDEIGYKEIGALALMLTWAAGTITGLFKPLIGGIIALCTFLAFIYIVNANSFVFGHWFAYSMAGVALLQIIVGVLIMLSKPIPKANEPNIDSNIIKM